MKEVPARPGQRKAQTLPVLRSAAARGLSKIVGVRPGDQPACRGYGFVFRRRTLSLTRLGPPQLKPSSMDARRSRVLYLLYPFSGDRVNWNVSICDLAVCS